MDSPDQNLPDDYEQRIKALQDMEDKLAQHGEVNSNTWDIEVFSPVNPVEHLADIEDRYPEEDEELIVYLHAPLTHQAPLWRCWEDPRPLDVVKIPSLNQQVELEFDSAGACLCQNQIKIFPDDLPGYHVMTEHGRHEKMAKMKYWLDRLDSRVAGQFRLIRGLLQLDPSISDVYRATLQITDNPVYLNRLPLIIKMFSKLPGFDQPISQIKPEVYINWAGHHLFYFFAGGEAWLIPNLKQAQIVNPTKVTLLGQELWWLFHLVSPTLDRHYWDFFGSKHRANYRRISAQQFSTAEGFAIDYWQTWIQAFEIYKNRFDRWFEKKFGPKGGPKLITAVAKFYQIEEEKVTSSKELDFKVGIYMTTSHNTNNPLQLDVWDYVLTSSLMQKVHEQMNREE